MNLPKTRRKIPKKVKHKYFIRIILIQLKTKLEDTKKKEESKNKTHE